MQLSDSDTGHLHLRVTDVAHKRIPFHGHNKSCQSNARHRITNLFRSFTTLTASTFVSTYRQFLGFIPAGSSITKRNVKINLETNLEPSKQLKLLLLSLLLYPVLCLHFRVGQTDPAAAAAPGSCPAPGAPLGSQRLPAAPPAPRTAAPPHQHYFLLN